MLSNDYFDVIYGDHILSYYRNTEFSSVDDFYFLKAYKQYSTCNSNSDKKIPFTFEDKQSDRLSELNRFYGIDKIAGEGTEMQKIARLKKWAMLNLHFKGNSLPGRIYDNLSCYDIIETAKRDGYALNCRYISLVFTQILLSAGFRARWVVCNSMDLRDTECHCVSEVYIETLHKWIVVDVALGNFYFNMKWEPLGLWEMRQTMACGQKFRLLSNNLNQIRETQLYWLKNIFRFKFIVSNKFNMLNSSCVNFACLNPQGFIMHDRIINIGSNVVSYKFYYDYNLFY